MTVGWGAAGHRKDGRHWTETATPEQLEAWKAKMKKGRDDFFAGRKRGRGRPPKFNYKKGWDPAKKSAASKATWEKWKTERPNARKNFYLAGRKAQREKYLKRKPLRDEKAWAVENNVRKRLGEEYKTEQERLYKIAESLLAETGVTPEKNQPLDYYKELINFFKPGTV